MLFRQKISIEIWQRMLDHPSTMYRKALGFFKEEINSVLMQQFVGLRPKCYAFRCMGNVRNNLFQHSKLVERKTAKGVKRRVSDAHLHFAHYWDALNNFHTYICRQNLIKSTLHTVHTLQKCKTCLIGYGTKRWLCDVTIHTHAHGHQTTLLYSHSS